MPWLGSLVLGNIEKILMEINLVLTEETYHIGALALKVLYLIDKKESKMKLIFFV